MQSPYTLPCHNTFPQYWDSRSCSRDCIVPRAKVWRGSWRCNYWPRRSTECVSRSAWFLLVGGWIEWLPSSRRRWRGWRRLWIPTDRVGIEDQHAMWESRDRNGRQFQRRQRLWERSMRESRRSATLDNGWKQRYILTYDTNAHQKSGFQRRRMKPLV